jgi:hypothetical protein
VAASVLPPVILLYLSPGFGQDDLADSKTEKGRDYYFQKLKGDTPLRDNSPGTNWVKRRTQRFGDWQDVRNKVSVLNIGAYHSKTFSDYSVLAALPSSRVSLDWAQTVLFPEAEAGKRIVICMRTAAYWGLEKGRRYSGTLYAPLVNRGGYLLRNSDNDRLIELVRARVSS